MVPVELKVAVTAVLVFGLIAFLQHALLRDRPKEEWDDEDKNLKAGTELILLICIVVFVGAVISAVRDMVKALEACAAPWDSGPTTVQGAAALLAKEFQRRMNIAGAALTKYRDTTNGR